MSYTLPHDSVQSRVHQSEEETLQTHGQSEHIVSININSCETACSPTSCHEEHPVPLPSLTDSLKPSLTREMDASVFPEVDQCEEDSHREQAPEQDCDDATGL
jgi:hypothetical protein